MPRGKVTPLSAERVALQTSIAIAAYENLRYAQALLGHQLGTSDLAEVIERASEAIVREAEKQKFSATSRPRPGRQGSSADPRHIPAAVKRAVWERDGGQCGFVSEAEQRCPARTRLEFDHVDPVARGGTATVEGIRLRCRTHNQYEAECVFGAGFMSEKREAKARARAQAADPERDVTPWLRKLGVRAEQARRIAASCEALPSETSLEERVRFALRQLAPPHRHVAPSRSTAA